MGTPLSGSSKNQTKTSYSDGDALALSPAGVPVRWPRVDLTLRQLLVTIATVSLALGLLLHFLITYFAFRDLNNSYWTERLQRQAAAVDGLMGWWLSEPREERYPDWLKEQLEPAVVAVYRITRVKDANGHETDVISSIASRPSWTNRETVPPMDQARLKSALGDLKA